MELIYKIDFNSTNFYFKNILDDLIIESKVKVKTKMYRGFILIICNDLSKNIEDFFTLLEKKLPLSIFLEGVSVLESFHYDAYEELEDKEVKINLTLLTNDEINTILEENHIDFSNDINKIKDGGISRFETHNGLKDIFLPSKKLREKFENSGYEVKLLITNINKINDLLDVSVKDLQLLCSIERPLVKLKFKLLKNTKKEYSNTQFIYAKIPDDKETVLFSQALKDEGIDYLLYVNDEVYQDGLKVTYTDTQNIVVHGEKGLFPKYEYELDRKVLSSKDYFDEYGSVYKSVIAQFNKRTVPSIGIYFSYKSDESAIKVNVPIVGEKDVILIPNVINNIENCLEDIKCINENSSKLIENYKNKFPNFFEKEYVPNKANGFESILNLLSFLLGMRDYIEFEDTALLCDGKNSLQIDMNVVKVDGKNYLDYRKIIQSALSYKIAGVENTVIAYSFFESLSDFATDNVSKINSELKSKDIIFCGNMFSNTILLSKLKKSLETSNILIPLEYPLDY